MIVSINLRNLHFQNSVHIAHSGHFSVVAKRPMTHPDWLDEAELANQNPGPMHRSLFEWAWPRITADDESQSETEEISQGHRQMSA